MPETLMRLALPINMHHMTASIDNVMHIHLVRRHKLIVVHEGAKVEFNEGEDARQYENCIVECSWDGEDGVWRFMRVRTDKHHPNAKHVYEKVMASIEDNIEEDDIIAEVAEAMKEPVYDKDRPPGAVFAQ